MDSYKDQILSVLENLYEAKQIIFTQIVNLAMENELKEINEAFEEGDTFVFELEQFEELEDVNVRELVELYKNAEESYYKLVNLNAITEEDLERIEY